MALLGPDANQDAVSFWLDVAQQLALDYCNLDELPSGLENTVVRMAADLYRFNAYGTEDAAQGAVTSLKEGDQSVTFASVQESLGTNDSLLRGYKQQLRLYRRLRP